MKHKSLCIDKFELIGLNLSTGTFYCQTFLVLISFPMKQVGTSPQDLLAQAKQPPHTLGCGSLT